MRPLLLLSLAALLLPACADPSLELEDCRSSLATARTQRKAGTAFAAEVVCDVASHQFTEAYPDADFPAALRRDRFAFSTLLAERCAGAGSEAAVRDCITAASARVQTACAGAVSPSCAGGGR